MRWIVGIIEQANLLDLRVAVGAIAAIGAEGVNPATVDRVEPLVRPDLPADLRVWLLQWLQPSSAVVLAVNTSESSPGPPASRHGSVAYLPCSPSSWPPCSSRWRGQRWPVRPSRSQCRGPVGAKQNGAPGRLTYVRRVEPTF
jgi:hypothetical protein